MSSRRRISQLFHNDNTLSIETKATFALLVPTTTENMPLSFLDVEMLKRFPENCNLLGVLPEMECVHSILRSITATKNTGPTAKQKQNWPVTNDKRPTF
eukprot:jgi/Bigna1/142666/aug1.72_g17374